MESHRHSPQAAPWRPSLAILGTLASFSLVLVLVGVLLWIGNQGRNASTDRAATLQTELGKLRADDKQRLETYGWEDKPKGIVRVPIERAMELLVADPSVFPEPPLPAPKQPPGKQADKSGKEPEKKEAQGKKEDKKPEEKAEPAKK